MITAVAASPASSRVVIQQSLHCQLHLHLTMSCDNVSVRESARSSLHMMIEYISILQLQIPQIYYAFDLYRAVQSRYNTNLGPAASANMGIFLIKYPGTKIRTIYIPPVK